LEFEDDGVMVVTIGFEFDTAPDCDAELDPDTDVDGVFVVTTGFDVEAAPEVEPEIAPDKESDVCAKDTELDATVPSIIAPSAITAHSSFMVVDPF
jgi:hypothetical protein